MSLLDNDTLVRATGHKITYHPYGVSRELFEMRDEEILVAGPKGTGKSLGVLQKQHLVLSKYPEARGFMSRKTRASMTNSCLVTYMEHVLKPQDRVHFHKQDQQFIYPNKSILAVIGLDNVDRLNSSEWDIGFMQECTECSEHDWEVATACLRNMKVPYQQLIGDCNPDKPTHWVKQRCDKGLTKMLLSRHQDNPRLWNDNAQEWTPFGVTYLKKLQRLSGVRHSRLYLGQWVAAEGVVYDTWDPQMHMIDRKDLPEGWTEWPHVWGVDFGYQHPFVWSDYMESPEGVLYLNREIYETKGLVEDHARHILRVNEGLPRPYAIICDHDAEDRATLERHLNLPCLPAFKSIKPGIEAVQRRLRPDYHKTGPGLYILRDALVRIDEELKDAGHPVCTAQEFDGYVWDVDQARKANSKKDELPKDKDNHGMDTCRYVVAFVDSIADDPEDIDELMVFEDEVSISQY